MTKHLSSADFSNIEGRANAWLAGEEPKLDAFRAFDAGTGHDLYLVAAGDIFGIPPAEAKPYRQIGKVSELALGFGGGANAFAQMAATYGLEIADQFDTIWSAVSQHTREEVEEGWESFGKKAGMLKRAWFAAEAIKRPWRAAHPAIVQSWKDYEEAAVGAVQNPGTIVVANRHISYKMAGSFLFCRLPSGRVLSYAYPRIEWTETPWGAKRPQVLYKGVDSRTRKWSDQHTYGGKLCENVTQAVARDIMRDAMFRCEAAGYRTLFTVHDEIVAEVDADFGSLAEFEGLMAENPVWAPGLPIAVSGWRGVRYRK